jgi:GTP pyrophosphokinase
MARDIRVILIMFADRLHNMRTLFALNEEKKRRIAQETLDIYAPLAHRFGIALVRWELEDLSFKYLEPIKYKKLAAQVQTKRGEREKLIDQFKEPLQKAINEAGLHAEVSGRPKHLYSIHKKMERRGKSFEEIYDLLGLRVMAGSVAECYHILGLVHSTWTPLHDRFKDYIATPKSNMYQSLHTTVYGPAGQMIEVQIRTSDMHRTAEYGIAAHWKFKESQAQKAGSEIDRRMVWLREVLEWQNEAKDPREFMEFLKVDLFHDEVFVFTPGGELIKLPAGATLVDFAFAVHTEVGLQCSGGKIDGKIAPLNTRLKSGQTVEIITNANTKPSKDWLKFVRTSKARSKIRSWVREQEYADSVKLGKEMLARELKRRRKGRVDDTTLTGVAVTLNVSPSSDKLFEAMGQGSVSVSQVIHQLFPEDADKDKGDEQPSAMDKLMSRISKGSAKGIKLQGIGNLMVTYAGCCQPVPGDKVEGYITRGRGITIHRSDCPNLLRIGGSDRRMPIEWESDRGEEYVVRLLVSGTDRKGVLAEMTSAITDTGTNIRGASTKSGEFDFTATFVVEVSDLKQLKKIIASLKKIKGIDRVQRKESFSTEAMHSSS